MKVAQKVVTDGSGIYCFHPILLRAYLMHNAFTMTAILDL